MPSWRLAMVGELSTFQSIPPTMKGLNDLENPSCSGQGRRPEISRSPNLKFTSGAIAELTYDGARELIANCDEFAADWQQASYRRLGSSPNGLGESSWKKWSSRCGNFSMTKTSGRRPAMSLINCWLTKQSSTIRSPTCGGFGSDVDFRL